MQLQQLPRSNKSSYKFAKFSISTVGIVTILPQFIDCLGNFSRCCKVANQVCSFSMSRCFLTLRGGYELKALNGLSKIPSANAPISSNHYLSSVGKPSGKKRALLAQDFLALSFMDTYIGQAPMSRIRYFHLQRLQF